MSGVVVVVVTVVAADVGVGVTPDVVLAAAVLNVLVVVAPVVVLLPAPLSGRRTVSTIRTTPLSAVSSLSTTNAPPTKIKPPARRTDSCSGMLALSSMPSLRFSVGYRPGTIW